MRNKHEIFLVDVDLLYLSDENKGADNKLSRNTIIVENTGERAENSSTDQGSLYSIDAPIDKN